MSKWTMPFLWMNSKAKHISLRNLYLRFTDRGPCFISPAKVDVHTSVWMYSRFSSIHAWWYRTMWKVAVSAWSDNAAKAYTWIVFGETNMVWDTQKVGAANIRNWVNCKRTSFNMRSLSAFPLAGRCATLMAYLQPSNREGTLTTLPKLPFPYALRTSTHI